MKLHSRLISVLKAFFSSVADCVCHMCCSSLSYGMPCVLILDCTFKIQIYQDTSKNETQPVMLYTDKSENQAMVVCCQNTREVIPKTMVSLCLAFFLFLLEPMCLQNVSDSSNELIYCSDRCHRSRLGFLIVLLT